MNFISEFGGVFGLLAAVVFGVFSMIGLVNKNSKLLKKDEVETAKDVIALLTTKVEVLETKVTELENKVDALTTENRTLRDVLQGRDQETKQFQKDMYMAFEAIKHSAGITEQSKNILERIKAMLDGFVRIKK